MSTIRSLSVTSNGVITFRWEGTGETLNPTDATAYQGGTVSGTGAQPTNGGQPPLNLTGWTAAVVPLVPGRTPYSK